MKLFVYTVGVEVIGLTGNAGSFGYPRIWSVRPRATSFESREEVLGPTSVEIALMRITQWNICERVMMYAAANARCPSEPCRGPEP